MFPCPKEWLFHRVLIHLYQVGLKSSMNFYRVHFQMGRFSVAANRVVEDRLRVRGRVSGKDEHVSAQIMG